MDEPSFENYQLELFAGEDPDLVHLHEEAQAVGIPTIQVPPDLGRLLTVLITLSRPKRVLELGTLFGYSSIVMARALPPGGHVWTLEVSAKHAEVARKNLDRAGVGDRVTVCEGEALESIRSLGDGPYDFVFIDADKPGYPAYLDAVLERVVTGSVIVADNLWRRGSVLRPEDDGTEAIARFNRNLAANPRLVSMLVPTRGGDDAASVSVVK